MKINIVENGLLIVPENEFEEDYIDYTFGRGDLKCFVKCGISASALVGIKICAPDQVKVD